MSEWRRVLEVRGKCESSQGGQNTLHNHIELAKHTTSTLFINHCNRTAKQGGILHHRNPNVNPPIRQELVHDGPLRREHVRVLPVLLLFLFLLAELRSRVVDGTAVDNLPIAGLDDPARGVRWRTELVGLGQHAGFAVIGSASLGGAAGDAVGGSSAQGAEAERGGSAPGEEELGDCDGRHCV